MGGAGALFWDWGGALAVVAVPAEHLGVVLAGTELWGDISWVFSWGSLGCGEGGEMGSLRL